MTHISRLSVLLLLVAGLFLLPSCKTKQMISEEESQLEQRTAENKEVLEQSGLDSETIDQLAKSLEEMDKSLMDFMETDPDAEAQIAKLKEIKALRESKLKSSMTEEQYETYRKTLRLRTKMKSMKDGAPLRNPNG